MKNYVARVCFQVEDEEGDVGAIKMALKIAQTVQAATRSNIPEFVEVGPPGKTLFHVSSEAGVLLAKRKK